MACEIQNTRRALFLGNVDALCAQPIRERRVATTCVHDHIGAHVFDLARQLNLEAFDDKTFARTTRQQPPYARTVDESYSCLPRRITAHDELKRRSSTEENGKILI